MPDTTRDALGGANPTRPAGYRPRPGSNRPARACPPLRRTQPTPALGTSSFRCHFERTYAALAITYSIKTSHGRSPDPRSSRAALAGCSHFSGRPHGRRRLAGRRVGTGPPGYLCRMVALWNDSRGAEIRPGSMGALPSPYRRAMATLDSPCVNAASGDGPIGEQRPRAKPGWVRWLFDLTQAFAANVRVTDSFGLGGGVKAAGGSIWSLRLARDRRISAADTSSHQVGNYPIKQCTVSEG